MEMVSVLILTLVRVGPDDFDVRDAEHSMCELGGSHWSSGPGWRKLLGPEPCCLPWFVTSVSAKDRSHQRWFFCSQGERWASLSVRQPRGKNCHHANHINSSGTMSGGFHLSCLTQPRVQPYFRP